MSDSRPATRRLLPRRSAAAGRPVRLPFLAHVAMMLIIAVAVAGFVMWGLWLALGQPRLGTAAGGVLTPSGVFDGVKIALAVVGGIGAVVALVVAYRRQRFAEREHEREDTRLFTERFSRASEQIGSDKAAVRLAGIYAMARLADDWGEPGQQMCIDVLCAYLRMPYTPPDGARDVRATDGRSPDDDETAAAAPAAATPAPGAAPVAAAAPAAGDDNQRDRRQEREVRYTVIRLIGLHLQADAAASWRGRTFDFRGAAFDGGDFRGAVFSAGTANFRGATFAGGTVTFTGATFSGATIDFGHATFSGGRVTFTGAVFSAGTVAFNGARVCGGRILFDGGARFSGGTVSFARATVSDGGVLFTGAVFTGGRVDFRAATFSGGRVEFRRAAFVSGDVTFDHAWFVGGVVDFGGRPGLDGEPSDRPTVAEPGSTFAGGKVSFDHANFVDGHVTFRGAVFAGGLVDLARPHDWTQPPRFDHGPGDPPEGLDLPRHATA
ncbi:MAG TPA: hypothetical protein VFR67_11500 [Pilimelia sp.]|nr:hypothetical protein [Pilimelia sp.]